MKTTILFLFAISLGFSVYSQDLVPEMAEPDAANKVLIDSLVKVSKFDQYFIEFCSNKIDREGWVKEWSDEEVLKRKSRIDFKKFMDYTVYNAFYDYSKQDLLDIISLMERLNKGKKYSWSVFTNTTIENNLDLYVKSKYLD